MNKRLLSICIPTYNRAACLKECLESIVQQFSHAEVMAEVEVVISDNGSTDATAEIVSQFRSRYPNINYSKNSENLGFDRNALEVVARATGEFVWFLGDDDALFPDALVYMLKHLKQERFRYCLVNSWGYNKSLSAPALSRPNSSITEDRYFGTLADFVRSLNYSSLVGIFGYMSVQIFKREIWDAFPNKEKFIGSQIMHSLVLLSAMKEQKFALLAKPLVKGRADNVRWEISPGLRTMSERVRSTHKTLMWIIDFYDLPNNRLLLETAYYKSLFSNWGMNFLRNFVFKNQRVRDRLKKILGK